MNQNNNQLQQGSQVSQEELAKTQVLNLNDVKELATFERKTSKKPAILLAIAGIFSITVGFAYPNIMTALDNAPIVREETTETAKNENKEILNKVQSDEQVCKFISPQNGDGTSGTVTYTLQYNENNQLQSYAMILTISPLSGNAQGVTATQTVYDAYKVMDNIPLVGYTMTTSLTETGMKAVNIVDLTKLDKTTLTPVHMNNYFAQVPFTLGDTKEKVAQLLTPGGFICE